MTGVGGGWGGGHEGEWPHLSSGMCGIPNWDIYSHGLHVNPLVCIKNQWKEHVTLAYQVDSIKISQCERWKFD